MALNLLDPDIDPIQFRIAARTHYPTFSQNPAYPLLCLEEPSLGVDCRHEWFESQIHSTRGRITRELKRHDLSFGRRLALTEWSYWYWQFFLTEYHHEVNIITRRKLQAHFCGDSRVKDYQMSFTLAEMNLKENRHSLGMLFLYETVCYRENLVSYPAFEPYHNIEINKMTPAEAQYPRMLWQQAMLTHLLESTAP